MLSKYLRILESDGVYVAYHTLFGNAAIVDKNFVRLAHQLSSDSEFILSPELNKIKIIEEMCRARFISNESEEFERNEWVNNVKNKFINKKLFSEGIVFVLTSACNLQCKYCIANHDVSLRGKLSIDDMKYIIDEYINNCVATEESSDIVISFTGGEPTLEFKKINIFCEYLDMTYAKETFKVSYTFDAS